MKATKKFVLTALTAALLLLPMGTVAIAENAEASMPQQEMETDVDFVPGQVPAELSATDVLSPALHGVVLAMLNHDVTSFDASNPELAWESVYNMLSLYGQLDERSEYQGDDLLVLSEGVADYASAILPDLGVLGQLPGSLSDRMSYDANSDSYLVACGSDDLAQLNLTSTPTADGKLMISGSMVYTVDGTSLAQFEAVFDLADNMFGHTLVSLELK